MGRYPEDTPKTNEVLKACEDLPWGSAVQIPDGHPPSDPWELARTFERDYATLAAAARRLVEAKNFKMELIGVRWNIYYNWPEKQYLDAFREISEIIECVEEETAAALAEVEALLRD